MNLSGLLPLLQQLPPYRALLAERPSTPQALLPAARPYVAAGLATHADAPLVLLTARSEMALQLEQQLVDWLPPLEAGGPPVYRFAEPDALPYERIPWSNETRQQRLTALSALQSRSAKKPIIVASARALMQKTLPARELRLSLRPLKVGEIVRLEQMAINWAQTGYTAEEVVEEPGTFARRGGIIDIWPPNLTRPVRIDLFGDEVESLRYFDPTTQRSEQNVDAVEIGPGSEALTKYAADALERLHIRGDNLNALENLSLAEGASPLQDPDLLLAMREELRTEVSALANAQSFRGIEWYLPYFYDQPASLLGYLPDDALLVVDGAAELMDTLHELEGQAGSLREELMRSGELPRDFASSAFTRDELRERLLARDPILLGYSDLYGKTESPNTPIARNFAPGPRYGGKVKEIVRDVQQRRDAGDSVVLATRQAARMQSLLADAELDVPVQSNVDDAPRAGRVVLAQGLAGEGFVMRGLVIGNWKLGNNGSGTIQSSLPHNKDQAEESESAQPPITNYQLPVTNDPSSLFNLSFLTDTELFGSAKPRARRRTKKQSTVAPEVFFADVKEGDYVVHLEHGIGRYEGLVQMEISGVEREYLQVTYAKSDKLYVPVHQADRLSRYVGASENNPIVSRLGTADWQTVKERAQRAIADIADDLLALYAERELVSGHAYAPDGPWQEEMEAAFPYQETEDQLTAINQVKHDMETPQPMDRVIVGDVGYGKTEVAVRAAFKAIADGKQVAMLVPTTVLAQQHYRTFNERMGNYPMRIDLLSRFRTPAQQEKTLAGLREGTVDMVIGTHRLLSRDLEFKDMGLLIIDEEQRFGVVQKERLKTLRTQLDVLSLSATPIPRTLHMSLSGVRDMSTITTAPQDRQPVHTVLAEYDDLLVRQAIGRELARGGQVFFVHNRVRGIRMLAERIQRAVPEARIVVGHGQMGERELEDAMLRFTEGEADVLVATTIIENGLDIPNANTIIISRADKMGLAQLYQLRGRVGRGSVRGHCYLLYDKGTTLSFDARRRLSAIIESSEEMGAGFRIAMRDLEIRGAGDLLGSRQSGNIDTVGFDLYTRLLAQAINEAKRKKEVFEAAESNGAEEQSVNGVQGDGEVQSGTGNKKQKTENGKQKTVGEQPSPFDLNDPLAPPVTLDLPLDARIPEAYIADEGLRLQIYRRIAGMTTVDEIEEMRRELVDRFGPDTGENSGTHSVPAEVENLLFQIRVKMLALQAGVANIGRELEQIVVRSETLENMNRKVMERRLQMALGHLEDENFIPEEAARVGRRAIYLPVDEAGKWKSALVRTLQIMAYS